MGIGEIIVILALAALTVWCAGSILKEHKKGGCGGSCSGCNGSCKGCGSEAASDFIITIKKKRQ